MKCPICNCLEDKVFETRVIGEGSSIRRRRGCTSCGYRFTTYEHIEEKNLMIIKRDGRREQFNIDKLSSGVNKAIEKRPVSQIVIEELLHSIEEEAVVKAGDKHEISSFDIGKMVMQRLHKLDQVAYIRFASVYRKFEDVKEFVKEVEKLRS
ncbi:MAG: transcriptional repressor NrdR [Spirochaetes bacterium]|nr:transcriptional repressor NrdR [Spirochaetota bacterium]